MSSALLRGRRPAGGETWIDRRGGEAAANLGTWPRAGCGHFPITHLFVGEWGIGGAERDGCLPCVGRVCCRKSREARELRLFFGVKPRNIDKRRHFETFWGRGRPARRGGRETGEAIRLSMSSARPWAFSRRLWRPPPIRVGVP